jgi:hypothetical protein
MAHSYGAVSLAVKKNSLGVEFAQLCIYVNTLYLHNHTLNLVGGPRSPSAHA